MTQQLILTVEGDVARITLNRPRVHNALSIELSDKLIEAARTEFDKARRIEMYHRFHEILHEEQPYTFLYCPKGLMAVDRRFHGIEIYKVRPGYDIREWYVPKPMQRYM